jgi:hypothetical protein
MTFNIGVTGTSHGATKIQLEVAVDLVATAIVAYDRVQVCQGCCIGFDAQFTEAIRSRWHQDVVWICAHPPLNRSKCDVGAIVLSNHICTAADYLARDRRIVHHGEGLVIGAPHNYQYKPSGSGTWYTIRYAFDAGRDIEVVFPRGEVRTGEEALKGGTA